ncbi:hypothetical protein [Paenibacillus ginsengarvi]|uniref:Uncharacterized protein n=1 Tax=Paenibacillus ginsengarvi TaxID=400777 RepID=A0A3B0CSZ2_9BACL|nr:hypothetical protein [Paenibacillus ginsengarvi]RKN86758.1 hypothetical protein D7M11_02025 [Paenibacillus ginsengarvi]
MFLMELFPKATDEEIGETKDSLTEYQRFRGIVQELGSRPNRTEKQEIKYAEAKAFIDVVERAIRLIQDQETRKMMEMLYLRGERHKVVVLHFGSIMHPATVDRKIKKGIRTVANTIKDIG